MSHTIKPHSCGTIREMAYNYRRGELSEVDTALFEDTIASCPACGRYASRVIDMLDTVHEADAEDFLGKPIDESFSDDLFASILSGIEQDVAPLQAQDEEDVVSDDFSQLGPLEASLDRQRSPQSVVRLDDYMRSGSRHDDDPELATPSSSPVRFLLLAAMCCGLLGAAYLAYVNTQSSSPQQPGIDASEQQMLAKQAREIKHLKDFEDLSPQLKTPDAIKVFANQGARWHIEGKGPQYTLHLEQGTVLVEFLPTHKESLRVIAKETRVDVVGTVFYVSADEVQVDDEVARVGVLTGKVRVKTSPEQEVVELEDGEQIEEDSTISTIAKETFDRSQSLVDLDAHRAVLKQRADARLAAKSVKVADKARTKAAVIPESKQPPVRETKKPAVAPEQGPSERELLQAKAQQAMKDKDYSKAAKSIEALLNTLPKGHMERATFRLELARIYMRHIGKRDKAISHLRTFVNEHSDDVAAPSARRQLCRLLGSASASEPECLALTPGK